ncbi:MAG: VWA domain-containing protein [Verrucomicrobia bacterium]|nr:VWA domain-containing protein [Verrucomicrobiota bacterium]
MAPIAMTFAKPEMLWLLAVTAPLLTWFLIWAWRKRQQLIARFVQSRLLAQLTVGVSKRRQQARLALLGLASLLLLVALARPQLGFAWEEVHQRGLDLFVAVDTSRSMLVADVSPNRLTRAKLAALDLMKLARTDRLALIAFAGTAFLQCPLTLDDNAFQQSVNLLDVGLLPQGGTAIAQAIDVALAAAKSSGDNYKALVLFTDGEDFGEDFSQDVLVAANRAAEAGLRIFPVGVGTATGDRIRLVDEQGRTTYVLDAAGEPVVSKLNAPLLRELAEKTGGDFLPLTGADPMRTLYEARLGRLPKSDVSTRLLRQYHERFQWPLAVAIGLARARALPPGPQAGAAAAGCAGRARRGLSGARPPNDHAACRSGRRVGRHDPSVRPPAVARRRVCAAGGVVRECAQGVRQRPV